MSTRNHLEPQWTTNLWSALAAFAWFTLSTLLMLEMREALNAATRGDPSDAAFKQGM